jgi:hypothetical protein
MGHGPCTFKKRDVKTALEAARAAGLDVQRVEIDKDGRIIIVTGKSNDGNAINEWDQDQTLWPASN